MLIKRSVILLALLAISTAAPVANAAQLIGQGTAPTIIDVRSSYEYQAGHIPGAIHIPFWSALYRVDEISTPKDELVIVYCAHGPRAGFGKFALTRAGYTQVLYLDGHMSGWYKAGLPVEK
jgi:hydroxyacylglutathione hydrolase